MKKLLISILLLLSLCLSLFACDGGNTDGGGEQPGGDGGTVDYSDYLYAPGVKPAIISNDSAAIKKSNTLYQALTELLGESPYFYQSDRVEDEGHEILIGQTSRPISAKAYRKLRTVRVSGDFDVRYVVYAEGNSIAIAYDDDYGLIALDFAMEALVKEVFKDKTEIDLKSGIVIGKAVSALKYYEAEDAIYKAEKWEALRSYLGSENSILYEALKTYYTQYDPAVVTWLANLYAPEIGGFYYSNSARNNQGYAPDIESTGQAMGFIGSSGMARLHGDSGYKVIGEEAREMMGNYIKSLQDPNGYFYNYQWTKASHNTSRLARDLSSSVGILSGCGKSPTYNTPLGGSGDGVVVPLSSAAKSVWLSESSSAATAVSKVVLCAHADYLENCDTLLAYLEARRLAGNSWYSIGSNITSQMNQIIARDNVLKREYDKNPENAGKPYTGLVDLVIDWFNKFQREDTGHWDATSNYLAVNGILKISGIYRQAKVAMAHSEKLVEASFAAITSTQELGGIVDIYNTWSAVGNVISNLRAYGESAVVDGKLLTKEERADRLLAFVRENAPEAVAATVDKLNIFKKPDGSYSYTPRASSSTSQGMPVAIGGTNEGDVNATVLAITGTTNSMFSALGLSGYGIKIFGSRELLIFLNVFEELGPVIKDGEDEESVPAVDEPVTFDDEDVGDEPAGVRVQLGGSSTAAIAKDSRGKGNVLEVNAASGAGTYVYVDNNSSKSTGKQIVFESDIRIDSGSGYIAQVTIGSHYMFTLHVSGERVIINENTTTSSGTSLERKLGERKTGTWFKLRVEYYAGGIDGNPRTKIYLDGTLVAVSDRYYGMSKTDAGKPTTAGYSSVKFYIMKDPAVKFALDNVHATVTDTAYTVEEDKDGKLLFNPDSKPTAGTTPAA